ncbi:MAG: hypothetical protein JWQ71_4030 [Pedosphaera sp.]|nr:hypothetical protein [Pedosphaera sp.]
MKPIDKNEIYNNLSDFLKSKGIDLTEGSATQQIQKGCNLLADSINLSQEGFARAKVELDKKLDQMRQVIHEKTAPKSSATTSTAGTPPPKAKTATSKARKTSHRKKAKSGKARSK